jgi:hypothetical protein
MADEAARRSQYEYKAVSIEQRLIIRSEIAC